MDREINVPSTDLAFKDGGTPFPIRFENMFLTKFVHVALASWQPEIWYQVSPSADN